jgi:3-hydroxyisobutyrate dehydrogenase
MMSLADQNVVEKIVFGDDGVAGSLASGAYLVDMSTVPPAYARDLAERSAAAGHKALDACVLGAPFMARSGDLRVMVGAQEDDFKALEGIFGTMGKDVTYLGGNGMGATMKLVLNMLMGVQMPALAEAVVFGERAGLPRDKILEMIAQSGYSSPVMAFRCMLMKERKFEDPSFKLALMRKDMMLVLDACKELDVPLPVSETAYSMLTAAKQQGLGDLDVAAILAFQERMAGLEGYPWPE